MPQQLSVDATLPLSAARFVSLSGDHASETADALAEAGAAHLARTSLNRLSGGELRRVLLARALARQPELLVLDEPTAGVDPTGQAALYRLGIFRSVRLEYAPVDSEDPLDQRLTVRVDEAAPVLSAGSSLSRMTTYPSGARNTPRVQLTPGTAAPAVAIACCTGPSPWKARSSPATSRAGWRDSSTKRTATSSRRAGFSINSKPSAEVASPARARRQLRTPA